jgi:hypothetical protein
LTAWSVYVPVFEIVNVDGLSLNSVSSTVNVFRGLPVAGPLCTTVFDGG